MTKTLKELQEENPEWCFNCGYPSRPGECQSPPSPLIAALIAAKREDEDKISELEAEKQAEGWDVFYEHKKEVQQLEGRLRHSQSQLTAEQRAHAETKKQLEEADKALISEVQDPTYLTDQALPAWEAALARQASINRPTDESPTDDPNSYLEKCPQCGGEADNGHDRCLPPNPYLCSKCSAPTRALKLGGE